MNSTAQLDDDMPAEIDFSGAERGKFYRPNARLNLPAPAIALRQGAFFEQSDLIEAVATLANAGADERGAIFTKREVVNFILDLCGYTVDRPLHAVQVLEPSFGGGDFLLPIIERFEEPLWRAAAPPCRRQVSSEDLRRYGEHAGVSC